MMTKIDDAHGERNVQQRGRFFCGIGAVVLPILFWSLYEIPDAQFKAFPAIIQVVACVAGVLVIVGFVFCLGCGLSNWGAEDEAS